MTSEELLRRAELKELKPSSPPKQVRVFDETLCYERVKLARTGNLIALKFINYRSQRDKCVLCNRPATCMYYELFEHAAPYVYTRGWKK